jgi:hypothetical protein
MKTCNICKEEKAFSEFYKEKRNSISGLRGDCKDCCKKRASAKYIPVPQENKKTHKGYTPEQKKQASRESSIRDYYKNKSRVREYKAEYYKRKRQSDPVFRLKSSITANVGLNLRMYAKSSKSYRTPSYIGCSFEQLFVHITMQFKNGMNWSNYGIGRNKWQIDHILPVSLAMNEEDVLILNHYSNLQPLWQEENARKSNKILYGN